MIGKGRMSEREEIQCLKYRMEIMEICASNMPLQDKKIAVAQICERRLYDLEKKKHWLKPILSDIASFLLKVLKTIMIALLGLVLFLLFFAGSICAVPAFITGVILFFSDFIFMLGKDIDRWTLILNLMKSIGIAFGPMLLSSTIYVIEDVCKDKL